MVERFLFNGIDTETGTASIGREQHFTVTVFSYEAKAAISRFHVTGARA
jgi:hypothetical protein